MNEDERAALARAAGALGMLIAANDPELYDWLFNVTAGPKNGSFVRAIADAGLWADHENYALLRPVLLELRRKYPYYDLPTRSVGSGAGGGRP